MYQNKTYTSKFQPPKDNLSNNERKAFKELQSHTSIVILPAGKSRYTVTFNYADHLGKYIDLKSNGPYQLIKKDSAT